MEPGRGRIPITAIRSATRSYLPPCLSDRIRAGRDYIVTSLLLRKFDEAERDRQTVNLLLTFTPFETLSASMIAEYGNDRYTDSPLGLQDA